MHTVGLNPFRAQSKSGLDIAMVVGALVLTLLVILWAVFGG